MAWPAILAALGAVSTLTKRQQPISTGRTRTAMPQENPLQQLTDLGKAYNQIMGLKNEFGGQESPDTLEALKYNEWMNKYLGY